MELNAKQIAEILGGKVEGDEGAVVSTFARIESGKPGSISFFANPKYEKYVYSSKATVIIVNNDFVPADSFPLQDNDLNSYSTTDTHWFDEYIGLGDNLYANVTLSSGTGKVTTYNSVSYYREDHTVKKDRQQYFIKMI